MDWGDGVDDTRVPASSFPSMPIFAVHRQSQRKGEGERRNRREGEAALPSLRGDDGELLVTIGGKGVGVTQAKKK
jgi:hypothetical protein